MPRTEFVSSIWRGEDNDFRMLLPVALYRMRSLSLWSR
jgi:hypothetical protein